MTLTWICNCDTLPVGYACECKKQYDDVSEFYVNKKISFLFLVILKELEGLQTNIEKEFNKSNMTMYKV